VHAPTKNKSDDKNDTRACIQSVPEVPYENYVRRFQCKNRKRRYFQTIENENLHEIRNDNWVTVVYFAMTKSPS
jgi:hypothetical protein